MGALLKQDIERLFRLLNNELSLDSVVGELYLVGGAVMCLVFNARPSTNDVDAFFVPAQNLRAAMVRVAESNGLSHKWLNDAVKGFLNNKGGFDSYLELPNLRVFAAKADYLLSLKCLSMRLGKEFHDEDDIRYLLRYLNIGTYDEALEIIARFYPLERFSRKTLHALEELLNKKGWSL